MKYADLHLHTFYSDGTYSPQGLVEAAGDAGLSAIAVVDHDTVSGITPVMECAAVAGIEIIPGIELTSEYEGREIHILGYLLDHLDKKLIKSLQALKEARVQRIHKIVAKLADAGVVLDANEVFEFASHGTVGRLHVARALVKAGKVGSTAEAFKRFIGDRGPAHVLGFRFSPQEAISLIKETGGVPILAHPYTINDDEIVFKLIDLGIMGLEAYYPEHTQSMINFYVHLAQEHNLLLTGGSDCHGNAKPEAKIGSVKIPYELVEKLKKAR